MAALPSAFSSFTSGPAVNVVQDGTGDGPFAPSWKFLFNGSEMLVESVDVALAQYGVATTIETRGPMIVDGVERDTAAESQANPLLPVAISVGMTDKSGTQPNLPLTQLEHGILEQLEDDAGANWVDVMARSDATLFQDTYVADGMNFSMTGDQMAALFAKTKGFAVVSGAPPPGGGVPGTFYIGGASPYFQGLPGYTEGQYLKAMRSRSMWDELRDAALADGFAFKVHNQVGYYGPAVSAMPGVRLVWGRDLISCEITHSGRRAHGITVRVDGYEQGKKIHHTVKYAVKHGVPQVTYSAQTGLPIAASFSAKGFGGGTSSDDLTSATRVYTFWGGTTDRESLRVMAQALYEEIVQHEFTAVLECVPDPPLLKLLCQVGAEFAVVLDGRKPSQNGTYYVREAALSMRMGESDASATLKITASNIPTQPSEALG